METMSNAEISERLRGLATFLEAHPEIGIFQQYIDALQLAAEKILKT